MALADRLEPLDMPGKVGAAGKLAHHAPLPRVDRRCRLRPDAGRPRRGGPGPAVQHDARRDGRLSPAEERHRDLAGGLRRADPARGAGGRGRGGGTERWLRPGGPTIPGPPHPEPGAAGRGRRAISSIPSSVPISVGDAGRWWSIGRISGGVAPDTSPLKPFPSPGKSTDEHLFGLISDDSGQDLSHRADTLAEIADRRRYSCQGNQRRSRRWNETKHWTWRSARSSVSSAKGRS